MAPLSITTTPISLLALLLSATNAFVLPSLPSICRRCQTTSRTTIASPGISARRTSTSFRMMSNAAETVETTEEKVARLRETAADFRSQAAALEDMQQEERRLKADRSFNTFDLNKDGTVDVAELQAGLAGPLRASFVKQLTKSIGRIPRPEEVEERIAQLPGGTLFPEAMARRLIEIYDANDDGVLQQSEFAPTEELRTRLENIFRETRDEERRARAAEREQEMALKQQASRTAAAASTDDVPTISDKLLSSVVYLLPLMDGVTYAQHLFAAYPDQMTWAQPLVFVLLAFRSIPFAPLVTFFGLSVLSRNPEINKLLRFNIRQAINFDLALIAPSLLWTLTKFSLGDDAAKLAPLADAGSDVLFIALLAAVAYSVGSSAVGSFPNKLPFFGRINRENPDQE